MLKEEKFDSKIPRDNQKLQFAGQTAQWLKEGQKTTIVDIYNIDKHRFSNINITTTRWWSHVLLQGKRFLLLQGKRFLLLQGKRLLLHGWHSPVAFVKILDRMLVWFTTNYLCNQWLSPLKLWVRIQRRRGELNTTFCDKVCQWHAGSRWFSLDIPAFSTTKTDHHRVTEILLKVALSTITSLIVKRNIRVKQ